MSGLWTFHANGARHAQGGRTSIEPRPTRGTWVLARLDERPLSLHRRMARNPHGAIILGVAAIHPNDGGSVTATHAVHRR